MDKISVRVTVRDVNPDVEERSPQLQFDIYINENERKVLGKWVIFGIWGSYKEDPNDIEPVLLHPDGRLDFGSGWEADRYGSCNLRDREIKLGSYVNVTASEGEDITYRIASIAVLGERTLN